MRSGLTLIELLVTIVIMVTLLAAVLPAVSPNNEGRKIREASRQLASLFAQAQSQAARDGRNVGVAFEDTDGDGIALEAFLIAEPAPFAGFSEASAVLVDQVSGWNPNQMGGFNEPFNVIFGHNVGGEAFDTVRDLTTNSADDLPPRTFHVGDIIEVGREIFQITQFDLDDADSDTNFDVENPTATNPNGFGFLKSQRVVAVNWLNRNGRPNELLPPGGRAYRIRRRPAPPTPATPRIGRGSGATLQFPRGVGVDLFCSGVESPAYQPDVPNEIYNYGFPTMKSEWMTQANGGTPPAPFVLSSATPRDSISVAIMFTPTGQLDSIYVNGERLNPNFSHVHLLLGRIENGNVDGSLANLDLDFKPADVPVGAAGDDIVRERRTKFNWLNGDSRLVNIDANSGRIVATDVAIPDPRQTYQDLVDGGNSSPTVVDQVTAQIGAGRKFGETLESAGGR